MNSSQKQLKALIINDSLALGGAEHQLYLLAKYLPSEWEKQVWVMEGGANREVLGRTKTPFSITPRKWKYDISPAFDLWKLILDWRPDVVHAWGWMSCIAALPICRIVGIPLINGSIRTGNRPLRWIKWLQWLSLITADGVIANSRSGIDVWDVEDRKSKVIYNGFETDRLKLCKQVTQSNKFRVVMVGRMEKEKDFLSYIDGARLASRDGRNWRFLAIGSGSERSKLVAYAKDLIDMKIIEFPEVGVEVLPLISTANVGVLMTTPIVHYEGCSNAIMEYMAVKLPVICTFGGGNPEIVIDDLTGFLIQPGDPNSLAERLTYLYDNRDEARRIGKAGYERFLKMFSVERMANETAEFYSTFLTKT